MLGPGRRPQRPSVTDIRPLTAEDLASLRPGKISPIQRFRDSHHRMARLFASGLRVKEVAELTGYSVSRVSLYHTNPAFQALVEEKRHIEDEVHRDQITHYNALILNNGIKAERKLADKLDDDDEKEEMSVRELVSISRDAADRVGLSKRQMNFNVNADFASILDRAIKRSLPSSGELKLVADSSSSPTLPLDEGPFTPPKANADGPKGLNPGHRLVRRF